MKSLSTVIEALEYCQNPADALGNCKEECPYIHNCDLECTAVKADALHYLKEYQGLSKMWNDKLDKEQANPAMTWAELKSMEGKPVWVESSDSFNRRRWMFVGEWFDDDEMRLFDMGYDYPDYVSKNGYESGTWQAYRKERE